MCAMVKANWGFIETDENENGITWEVKRGEAVRL